ncbi:hypothetical protein [Nocardiopsis alborubida]|uniref:Uncharacterized protein n=1 Tax=Nocardiopsis alborubida TaxID=146802 RepID=A0A7X6RRR4_9ACTN|nr:hypothetical protein [Nocardiopsis alborubida]NKZ00150.1 hypothetical protein [Nocardiopsis alborubida]
MGRTAHHDDQEEGEEGAKRKKFDLSVSQVAGAGAATLAAATAASYLNVYGTVIGAAGMAALSTLVSPLLQHWFSRGGEQARQLAGRASGHQGAAAVPDAPGAPVAPPPEGISETALLRQVSETGTPPPYRGEEDADATRTMALPVLDGRTRTQADPGATARMPAVGPRRPDPVVPDEHGGSDGATGAREDGRRRGWRSLAVPAAAVFVLVMLVILLFELFTGRSLTSWTQGSEEPSAPTLFGGSTSAPPAEEAEPENQGTGDDTPDPSVGDREEAPGADQPTEPAPETGAPGDEGTGGGTEEDAPDGTGGTTEPTAPPEGDGGTPDPGGQTPGPGTGEQGGGEAVPEPPPAVPQTG